MTLPIQVQTQSSQSSPTPLWTVDEVAAYLNFAPETIRNMARKGTIPAIKVGKRIWRFRANHIQAWLKESREPIHV